MPMTAPAPLLRFITAGSVDDGKSTLIGRLLYDSKALLSDQTAAIERAAAQGSTPDFAALTDGLSAEREQGITIDVAYRYFSTPKRKFIIADTPGHEQYTRNMVTGASTADAAIVLIDATRVAFSPEGVPELLPQTKRHSAILKLLGCKSVIAAVNKLDLLGFDQNRYEAITAAYRALAEQIGLQADLYFLPISALQGSNITTNSPDTPWFNGLPLLPLLESLPAAQASAEAPAHFPVQRVVRQDGSSINAFRGYQGRLEAGRLNVGDSVRVLPANQEAVVSEIHTPQGRSQSAEAGQVLTIALDREIDISRGDSIVAANNPIQAAQELRAAVCWFDDAPLNPGRKYLLKHSTHTTPAKIGGIETVWDVATLSHQSSAATLQRNDIAIVRLKTQRPVHATAYAANPATGAFILIDEATNHTVAAGMIESEAA